MIYLTAIGWIATRWQ